MDDLLKKYARRQEWFIVIFVALLGGSALAIKHFFGGSPIPTTPECVLLCVSVVTFICFAFHMRSSLSRAGIDRGEFFAYSRTRPFSVVVHCVLFIVVVVKAFHLFGSK